MISFSSNSEADFNTIHKCKILSLFFLTFSNIEDILTVDYDEPKRSYFFSSIGEMELTFFIIDVFWLRNIEYPTLLEDIDGDLSEFVD